ncbi:MAG: hypothetical protein ACRD3V_26425, partial [Vicinamibacteria bacterium]
VWREVLATAMEGARVEPWLEGEEIAGAIAAEIRALLESGPRGGGASGLMEGKVVERGDHLLVNPRALVRVVRSRLVDDVLPQATIAEAAAAHLGMRQLRPRFVDVRPRAWAFPLPLAAIRENGETLESTERSAGAAEENWIRSKDRRAGVASPYRQRDASRIRWTAKNGVSHGIRSMDRRARLASPLSTEGYEVDPMDRENELLHLDRSMGRRSHATSSLLATRGALGRVDRGMVGEAMSDRRCFATFRPERSDER